MVTMRQARPLRKRTPPFSHPGRSAPLVYGSRVMPSDGDMPPDRAPARRGAYGLALPDLSEAAEFLLPAPKDWASWSFRHRKPDESDESGVQSLHPDHARMRLVSGGWLDMDRPKAVTTLVLPAKPTDQELVHPHLASTAAVYARWQGWNAFHAGSVVIDGGAWGILGDRGAGKSSSLTWMALESDTRVLGDDMLVIDRDGHALAGPRCIDLRADAAEHFGAGKDIGKVGARQRWRLRIPDIAPRIPFRGWVELAWRDEVVMEAVTPSELFPSIVRNQSLRFMPPDIDQLMGLVALPAWRLSRPRAIDRIGTAMDALVDELRGDR